MNIFQYAMQMEKDGETYYRELAAACPHPGLQKILTLLAEQEARHYRIVEDMQTSSPTWQAETTLLDGVTNIFRRIQSAEEVSGMPASETDMLRKAQDLEVKSRTFYTEQAAQVEGALQKEIFEKLAQEEQRHFLILEDMIEFLQRPQNWLENAEWTHFDTY